MTLTAQDVAKDLKLSDQTVYKLAQAGKIKSFRVGRLIRFREEDLQEFKQGKNNQQRTK